MIIKTFKNFIFSFGKKDCFLLLLIIFQFCLWRKQLRQQQERQNKEPQVNFINEFKDRLNKLESSIKDLREEVHAKIAYLENKSQTCNERILKIELRLDQIRLEFDRALNILKEIIQRLDKLEQRQKKQDSGITEVRNSESVNIRNAIRQFLTQTINQFQNLLTTSDLIQFDQVRKDETSQALQQIYEGSLQKRQIDPQFRYFVRDEEHFDELTKNYGIRGSEIKRQLKAICDSFRQSRGDGNCFYTSFGYQFLLILLLQYTDEKFAMFFKSLKKIGLPMKVNLGEIKIDDTKLEDQLLTELFYRLQKLRDITDLEQRKQVFTKQFATYEQRENEETDGYLYGLSTIFFRNLSNYAVEFSDMKEALFDRVNLLIWEQECNSNEIVIAALAKYLGIHVKLLFFDNNSFKVVSYQEESCEPKIILLIKPGHYSIGIKKEVVELQNNSNRSIYINFYQILNQFSLAIEGRQ